MLNRLAGLESEYAIRFESTIPGNQPGNRLIFSALSDAIRRTYPSLPGRLRPGQERYFLSNGSSYCYEFLPFALDGGLFEGATAECRSVQQLLCQQRAQERIIAEAIPAVEARLRAEGYPGHLGLIRNAKDSEGHTYGPQENYEVEINSGRVRVGYLTGLTLLAPIICVIALALWLLILSIIAISLTALIIFLLLDLLLGIFSEVDQPMMSWLQSKDFAWDRWAGWSDVVLQTGIVWPAVVPFAWLVRLAGFKRHRRALTSFLVSRLIFTGTGTLNEDGGFALSEKVSGIVRMHRSPLAMSGRSIYDSGNLLKGILGPALFDWPAFADLFAPNQRFQIGLSDANRLDVAEFLKLGTTLLILDMVDAGQLEDAPQLRDPISALNLVNEDISFTARIPLSNGESWSAIELQEWYLQRAQQFVQDADVVDLEARKILELWEETLRQLKQDPTALLGQLDWVTKRYMLDVAGDELSMAERKKIDLKYHEVGSGYASWFRAAGFVYPLISEEAIVRATVTAPEDTPAHLRGYLVEAWAGQDDKAWISWSKARLLQGGKSRIVRFDKYQRNDP